METAIKIRRQRLIEQQGIKSIARNLNLSKNTVKKYLRQERVNTSYKRTKQVMPKLGEYREELDKILLEESLKDKKYRKTGVKIFKELQLLGYSGGYDSVRRYIKKWRVENGKAKQEGFIPLQYEPGQCYQFDWSTETLIINGVPMKLHLAHMILSYSNMPFMRLYLRESQEMVISAHEEAFKFYGGSCKEGKYDNMSTAVAKVLPGKKRQLTRLFEEMCGYYLVKPVMCNPASGWEKGKVERSVRTARQQFFCERRNFSSIEEANEWLISSCIAYAKSHKHTSIKDKNIWEVFMEEKAYLVPVSTPFDGYRLEQVKVSKTCLFHFDRNRYSVPCELAGKIVDVKIYADRLVVEYKGKEQARIIREFGRDKTIYNAWHYFRLLEKKPGALRDGAPFKNWNLPKGIKEVEEILREKAEDWDRQVVDILSEILRVGEEKVEAACRYAIEQHTVSKDIILGIIHKKDEGEQPEEFEYTKTLPEIKEKPTADCNRYDALLGGIDVA